MADKTKIEWTDATWNPITGCAVVSPGCTNCYAMGLAGTRLKHHPSRVGLTRDTKAGPVWTGEVRLNEEWMAQPLAWRRPRMIFVCAHGDLFAEGVPDAWIDRVFAVMALSPQHTFQVLTKRPKRMRDYLISRSMRDEHGHEAEDIRVAMTALAATPLRRAATPVLKTIPLGKYCAQILWPMPNVWLGVSVEDQWRADERMPVLRETPAAVRWISAEPLLGPVLFDLDGIDWIVAGGESGAAARPMHPDWIRAIRDQCALADVPFHFKQWGAWKALLPGGREWPTNTGNFIRLSPDTSRSDAGLPMQKVGKAFAGRILDGVTHDGYPQCDEVLF